MLSNWQKHNFLSIKSKTKRLNLWSYLCYIMAKRCITVWNMHFDGDVTSYYWPASQLSNQRPGVFPLPIALSYPRIAWALLTNTSFVIGQWMCGEGGRYKTSNPNLAGVLICIIYSIDCSQVPKWCWSEVCFCLALCALGRSHQNQGMIL